MMAHLFEIAGFLLPSVMSQSHKEKLENCFQKLHKMGTVLKYCGFCVPKKKR